MNLEVFRHLLNTVIAEQGVPVVDVADGLPYTPTLFGSEHGVYLPPAVSAKVGDMVYEVLTTEGLVQSH